jgi:hypothetical protein
MDHNQFNKVVDHVISKVKALLISKNDEYARGGDKLHNFKKAAGFNATKDQEVALAGMMLKHTVSIYDMIDDVAAGKSAELDLWEEKVVDHINYLIILFAMRMEADQETVTSDYSSNSRVRLEPHTANCHCAICAADDFAYAPTSLHVCRCTPVYKCDTCTLNDLAPRVQRMEEDSDKTPQGPYIH